MEVVILFNGLGNQMSQYAFYLQKKKLNKKVVLINDCKKIYGLELNKRFNLKIVNHQYDWIIKVIIKILGSRRWRIITSPIKLIIKCINVNLIQENNDHKFHEEYLVESTGLNIYKGGWHNEKYFSQIKEDIFETFKFSEVINDLKIEHLESIRSDNSVSIHIRRGDYINGPEASIYGGVCDAKYYEKAIELIKKRVENPKFYIFSGGPKTNDITWAKENLDINDAIYIQSNNGEDSWKDMYLMTQCKHNITANSTFSWWGAWLNQNENKIVVCPKKFLRTDSLSEIYPKTWLHIE